MSPEEKNEAAARLVRIAAHSSFSGPLPPPEILEKYDRVIPGAAERILRMAEDQHLHRQNLETKVVEANIFSQKAGMMLGFVIAMTAIGGGIWLSAMGKSGVGLTSIIGALAALVSVFIYGKLRQRKELDEKASALEHSIAESQQH